MADPIEDSARRATDPGLNLEDVTAPKGGTPELDPLIQAKLDELEVTRKNMEKGFTQKMQGLSERERKLEVQAAERERRFMDAQAQMPTQIAAGLSAANSPTRGLGEELAVTNPHIAENPAAQALFDQVGSTFDGKISTLEQALAERDKTIQSLATETQAMRNDQIEKQYRIEHAQLVERFGDETVQQHAQGIYDAVQASVAANPRKPIPLESAFISAAPEVFREHIREQERAALREEMSQESNASLAMDDLLGKGPGDTFKPGESFEETAMRHASPAMKAQMVREALDVE